VSICAADLSGELLKASGELPPEQRLTHLLVSHYRDAIGPEAELPEAWRPWFDTQHPLPTLPDGSVADWHEALACTSALGPHDRGPGDLSALPHTSGTTGMPKGCMHTHASILHNAIASSVWGNTTAEAVTLLVVPMFHITGMVSGLHAALYAGATIVLMPRWDRDLGLSQPGG